MIERTQFRFPYELIVRKLFRNEYLLFTERLPRYLKKKDQILLRVNLRIKLTRKEGRKKEEEKNHQQSDNLIEMIVISCVVISKLSFAQKIRNT